MQGGNAATLAARLAQQALLPDMMFPTVNRFNPNNGRPLPTANGVPSNTAAPEPTELHLSNSAAFYTTTFCYQ